MLRLLHQHVEYLLDRLLACVLRNLRSMRYGDLRNHYSYKSDLIKDNSVYQWTRLLTAWTYGICAADRRGHLKISPNGLEFSLYAKNDGLYG